MFKPKSVWRAFLFVPFFCIAAFGAGVAIPQQQTLPQQRLIPLDRSFLVGQCPAEQGVERNQCLVSLAFNNADPSFCEVEAAEGCLQLAAQAGVEICGQGLSGPDRYECETAVLVTYPASEACTNTVDPNSCYATVAAELGDPGIVTRGVLDPEARDSMLALYVTLSGDISAVDLIKDPFTRDGTVAMSVGSVGDLETGIDPAHCDRIRGNYGPDHEDIDVRTLTVFCQENVDWTNAVAEALSTIELEADREDFIAEAIAERQTLIAGLESGAINLYGAFPELDDGFEEFADGPGIEISAEVMGVLAEATAENLPEAPPAMEGCSSQAWTGSWCTNYYRMDLTADEHGFVGHYEWDNGSIEGTLDPATCTAHGQWFEDPNSTKYDWGHFEFTLDPATESFTGIWSYNTEPLSGDWHGGRCSD